MKIEISDVKYWKRMTYYDGILYCQLLDIDGKNDWRMITRQDVITSNIIFKNKRSEKEICVGDADYHYLLDYEYCIIPVRDINYEY